MKSEQFEIAVGNDDIGAASGLVGLRHNLGAPGPRILLTGAVHGDEVTASAALWRVAEALPKSGIGGQVTIIPGVNQLGIRGSQRWVPIEGSDLNRQFPGRRGGSLAERLAAALVTLLDDHDVLIDVHTAAWCTNFVLLDHIPDHDLARRVVAWAGASGLPVIGEAPAEVSDLQGLNRSWSAWAVGLGKPAVTIELAGFHTIDVASAEHGAAAVLAMMKATPVVLAPAPAGAPPLASLCRTEIFADAGGLFENARQPGEWVKAGQTIGAIRSLLGQHKATITAPQDGLILSLPSISAVQVGAHLVTLAIKA
jgi:predicted deacylase